MGAFLDLKSLNIPDEVKQYDLQLSGNKKNDMTLNENQEANASFSKNYFTNLKNSFIITAI